MTMASRSLLGSLPRRLRVTALVAAAVTALSWASVADAAGKSAGDYFVHSLPGAPAGQLVKMHAG